MHVCTVRSVFITEYIIANNYTCERRINIYYFEDWRVSWENFEIKQGTVRQNLYKNRMSRSRVGVFKGYF